MNFLSKAGLAVVAAVAAGSASASLITYDLANDGSVSSGVYTNMTGGALLTATGWQQGPGSACCTYDQDPVVQVDGRGLGVDSSRSDPYPSQLNGTSTGTQGDEWLKFSTVGGVLTGIDFQSFGGPFRLATDIGGVVINSSDADPWSGSFGFNSWFAVGAPYDESNFRVKSVTINTGTGNYIGTLAQIRAVPEPDTLVLLGAGLLALGLVQRRRAKA